MESDLCKLAEHYGVDKCPAIFHSYTPAYDIILKPYRSYIKSFLEIGIGNYELMAPIVGPHYQHGASLKMWRDYFPHAHIIGCDIRKDVLFQDTRIQTFYVDQSNEDSLHLMANKTLSSLQTSSIDIILDDGSHIKEHMKLSFRTLWKYITKGGFYIIEDIKLHEIGEFTDLASEQSDIANVLVHQGNKIWDSFVVFHKQS